MLGLSGWLAVLKQKNEDFNAKYLERVGETAANPLTNIVDLRTTATAAYKDLLSHIEAHNILHNNAAYTTMLDEISVLAKQYNLVVDNRATTTTIASEPTSTEVDNSL